MKFARARGRALISQKNIVTITTGFVPLSIYATISVVIAASTGLTILIAQNIGAKKVDTAKDYLHNSMFNSSILSLILFALWFFFPRVIFAMMGVDKALMGYCVGYVRIISFFLLLLGIDTSIQAALQGAGITKPIMYSGIARIILNILLDWIFIFGHFGFPRLGLYGAALSTALSNIASILFLFLYPVNSKRFSERLPFKISLADIFRSKNFDKFRDVLRIGLPTGFESFIWSMGILIFLRILNHLDEFSVGIYTLIYGIDIAVYGIYNGLAKEQGFKRIELDFWRKNANAGEFFRTQGFNAHNERMHFNIE